MTQLLIFGSVFFCVACLIFGIAMTIRGKDDDELAARLVDLTKNGGRGKSRKKGTKESISLLSRPLNDVPNAIEKFVSRFFNFRRYLDQAGVGTSTTNFLMVVAGLGIGTGTVVAAVSTYFVFAPMAAVAAAILPLGWLWFKQKSA